MSNTLHLDDLGSSGEDPSPRRRAKKKGPSPFTVIGVLLLVVGLGCLGWVGYQYFGTNVVSQKSFEEEKQGLRDKWANEPAAEKPEKGDKKKDKEEPKEAVIPGEAIALMRIPKIGLEDIPILSGTDVGTLSRGIGHYEGNAMPGEVGNFAVAGHRVTHGQPFARLLELNQGDEVIVETRDAVYTYVVDLPPKDLTVPDTETCVISPVPCKDEEPTRELLTLTTCQDLFHSPDRSIGYAYLEKTKDKA